MSSPAHPRAPVASSSATSAEAAATAPERFNRRTFSRGIAEETEALWTPLFAAFLAFVFVITSYELPIGDAAMVAALVALILQRAPLRFPSFLRWLVVLVAWGAVGYVATEFRDTVGRELTALAKLAVIALVAVNALRTRAQLRVFLIFFLACYALYPVRGTFINYYIAGYTVFGRAIWNYAFANPNDLAAYTLLQLGLAVSLVSTERQGWVRRAALVGTVVLVQLILMTQSRAAILGLAIAAIAAFAGHHRRARAALIAGSIALIVATAAPSGVWQRLGALSKATSVERLAEADPAHSAEQRYEIWRVAARVIASDPIVGVGVGGYSEAHQAYATRFLPPGHLAQGPRDVHSTYLAMIAEMGIPGFLLFAVMCISVIVRAERTRRRCRSSQPGAARQLLYLELGLLSFLIAGIFGSYGRLSFLYLYLALIWVAADLARREQPVPTDQAA